MTQNSEQGTQLTMKSDATTTKSDQICFSATKSINASKCKTYIRTGIRLYREDKRCTPFSRRHHPTDKLRRYIHRPTYNRALKLKVEASSFLDVGENILISTFAPTKTLRLVFGWFL